MKKYAVVLTTAIAFSTLIAIALISPVYANTPSVWCDPPKIPPGGTVAIHIRASFASTNITTIKVTNPGGSEWIWTGQIRLPDVGDEVVITFPGGAEWEVTDVSPDNIVLPDVTWSVGANTNTDGEYTVYMLGKDLTPVGSQKFNVSAYFSVPEFAVTSVALTAISFGLLNTIRKFKKKSNRK